MADLLAGRKKSRASGVGGGVVSVVREFLKQDAARTAARRKRIKEDPTFLPSVLAESEKRVSRIRRDIATDVLPIAGQAAGGVFGLLPAVVGATLGAATKQQAQVLQGKRDAVDPSTIGQEAMVTAIFEGVTRGTSKVLFSRFQAGRRLATEEGKQLKNMKSALENKPDAANIDDMLKPLKEGFEKIEVKTGEAASMVRKWIARLNQLKSQGKKTLTGGQLSQLEDNMGAVSKFGKEGPSRELVQQTIKNPRLNVLGKEANRRASEALDSFAARHGFKSFRRVSQTVSKLINEANRPNLTLGFGESAALGGFVGLPVTPGGPLAGIATFAAARLLDNRLARGILFRGIERSGVGRGATLAASEGVRRFLE